MKEIAVLNGPSLNRLGSREPSIYGYLSLDDINLGLLNIGKTLDTEMSFFQSNSEGAFIDHIHYCEGAVDGIILNPGAYAHYSYAIHDAIRSVSIPAVEVHLSNIHAREEFRRHSVTASACLGLISGLGPYGYELALLALLNHLKEKA
ncbi:type II 3-dehydroquinate dehydratase [Oscillospiraceae bacterium OttesenSCG-928-F05]|nr:type II 3-dehydroquinate dehydratase [Oscillospiraceae bacterium OttesenSCG-928-F05]